MPIGKKFIYQKPAKNSRKEVNFFTGHPVFGVSSANWLDSLDTLKRLENNSDFGRGKYEKSENCWKS